MAMATTKNTQSQYNTLTAVASKTITTVEVFVLGVQTIVEIICSDGTKSWITVNQGVVKVTSSQPYV